MRQLAFDSGPAALARRTPSWGLLATVGLHLLLAASWRSTHAPAPDTREERVFALIPLPAPAPARPTPPAQAARARPAPAAPAPAPRTVPEPEAITMPADAAQSAADPVPSPPEPEFAAAPQETMAARARREAIAVDRELRKGKPGVPEEADTRWSRFVGGLEDAHKAAAAASGPRPTPRPTARSSTASAAAAGTTAARAASCGRASAAPKAVEWNCSIRAATRAARARCAAPAR